MIYWSEGVLTSFAEFDEIEEVMGELGIAMMKVKGYVELCDLSGATL